MTSTTKLKLLFLAFALAGCGGGGGGSAPGGVNAGGGGGGSGGGGSNPPTADGTAEIIFPWTTSGAFSQTVTVRGTATDPDGVARVTVNGAVASLSAGSFKSSQVASSVSQGNDTDVTWSTPVQLRDGENTITVSVEDANSVVTPDADTATVGYLEVPITFTLDPDSTRIVGLTNTLTGTGVVQNLVEYNYGTGEQTVYGAINTDPALTCFRSLEDDFLYLELDIGNTWNLRRYDLETRQDAVLSNLPAAFLDGGPGFMPGSVRELVCGGTNSSAYVLVNFVEDNGQWYTKSRIVAVELAALDFSTLSETDQSELPPWMVLHIAQDRWPTRDEPRIRQG